MFADIEAKIVERLEAKLTTPARIAVDEVHKSFAVPSIEVICGGGTFARTATSKYKVQVMVYVVITFKNLRSTKDRRAGAYPILLACLGWLIGQKLDLQIEALKPKRLENVTEEEEAKAGEVVFQLEFETAFPIDKLTDEELDDLLTIGLNYYLTPGDDTADAADQITLREET